MESPFLTLPLLVKDAILTHRTLTNRDQVHFAMTNKTCNALVTFPRIVLCRPVVPVGVGYREEMLVQALTGARVRGQPCEELEGVMWSALRKVATERPELVANLRRIGIDPTADDDYEDRQEELELELFQRLRCVVYDGEVVINKQIRDVYPFADARVQYDAVRFTCWMDFAKGSDVELERAVGARRLKTFTFKGSFSTDLAPMLQRARDGGLRYERLCFHYIRYYMRDRGVLECASALADMLLPGGELIVKWDYLNMNESYIQQYMEPLLRAIAVRNNLSALTLHGATWPLLSVADELQMPIRRLCVAQLHSPESSGALVRMLERSVVSLELRGCDIGRPFPLNPASMLRDLIVCDDHVSNVLQFIRAFPSLATLAVFNCVAVSTDGGKLNVDVLADVAANRGIAFAFTP